ncbi:MAG: hypothetical protein ACRDJU_04850 [Actinomycetota bacterium]
MTTVADIAEPLAGICVAVPHVGEGVCLRCHNHPASDFRLCYSCAQSKAQLSRSCRLVVPVSLYEIPSQLHLYLRQYKSVMRPSSQQEFSRKVAALLCHFLDRHRRCIEAKAGGGWHVITAVPSTGGRPGEHPLVSALRQVPSVFRDYEQLLSPGSAPIGHNQASDDGFRPLRAMHGERVLVIDDTFTSGARAQSAASVLNNAGAHVVAIVPVGRVIDPSWEQMGTGGGDSRGHPSVSPPAASKWSEPACPPRMTDARRSPVSSWVIRCSSSQIGSSDFGDSATQEKRVSCRFRGCLSRG